MEKEGLKLKYKTNQPTIAILYICTGEYEVFWKIFYSSFEKRFLTDCPKDYFVFTDAKDIYQAEAENVHIIYQKQLGWPHDTLMRFDMFRRIKEELKLFEYTFFFNANCFCRKKIGKKEFLPEEEGLLFVQHPGMYNKSPEEFTYERDETSLAYIPMGAGEVYVCGGVNGGKTQAFLSVIEELWKRIERDKQHGIIAIYHDESHINRYAYEHQEYKLLSPSYCYPEGWKLPFKKKIILLDKSKYFDDRDLKSGSFQNKIKE